MVPVGSGTGGGGDWSKGGYVIMAEQSAKGEGICEANSRCSECCAKKKKMMNGEEERVKNRQREARCR